MQPATASMTPAINAASIAARRHGISSSSVPLAHVQPCVAIKRARLCCLAAEARHRQKARHADAPPPRSPSVHIPARSCFRAAATTGAAARRLTSLNRWRLSIHTGDKRTMSQKDNLTWMLQIKRPNDGGASIGAPADVLRQAFSPRDNALTALTSSALKSIANDSAARRANDSASPRYARRHSHQASMDVATIMWSIATAQQLATDATAAPVGLRQHLVLHKTIRFATDVVENHQ